MNNPKNIAIIGAGISGLMCAYTLQKHGHSTTLFTNTQPSASSLALGMLVPSNLQRPIDALQRQGIKIWSTLAAELAQTQTTEILSFFRTWPCGHQLNVPRTLTLLQAAFCQHGGQIQQREVTTLAPLIPQFSHLIIAAGAGTTSLIAPFNPQAIMGTQSLSRGHVIRLQSTIPLTTALAAENLFIAPDWNNTILVGSQNRTLRHTETINNTTLPADTLNLHHRATQLLPMLAEAKVIEAWVGHRPVSNPRLPLLRQVAPTVWAVAGLGKVGFALAPCVAQAALAVLNSPATTPTHSAIHG